MRYGFAKYNSGIYTEIREEEGIVSDKESYLEYGQKGKEELEIEVQKIISEIFKDYKFSSDVIMYKGDYYILRDKQKDMTIYYNAINNTIIGFYMGFEKD